MGKVQTYRNLSSYFGKAESFLLENEFKNNLFWEVMRIIRKTGKTTWAGNVFINGRIAMSSLFTPSGYLLVSNGSREAIERLVNYGKSRDWQLKGVTGLEDSVSSFSSKWCEGMADISSENRKFMIYATSCSRFSDHPTANLSAVGQISWPRAQTWATLFANESIPPLNQTALVTITREMMTQGNLFFLEKEGVGPCAMGGFGRSTPNCLVINEVFVPSGLRGKGYAGELITSLVPEAKQRGFSNCILFSDFAGERNLYDRLGFEKVGSFCERKLSQ